MISRTVEYALRAVVTLAQNEGRPVLTPTIAEITQVPLAYLSKVLQILKRHGLVRSQRGLGGGFVLDRKPEEITALDVVNAVAPIPRIDQCPLEIGTHGTNLCPLHRRLDTVFSLIEAEFARMPISELLKPQEGQSTPLCETGKRIVPASSLIEGKTRR